jgi:Tol biopolymer transport system component
MSEQKRREAAATDAFAIPDHQLLRRIGDGSYGEVWLACSAIGAFRAAKIVQRRFFDNDKPFEREFTGLLNFEPLSRGHEGFVDVLQVGRSGAGDSFYCIMELADDAAGGGSAKCEVRGAKSEQSESSIQQPVSSIQHRPSAIGDWQSYTPLTLDVLIRQKCGRLPVKQCLAIASTLASALQYLHDAGLVHRDIKPSNIIFVGGVPKLADVGLVARTDSARTFVGTEGFVPPEGPGTPRADIYSLGKCLYEMAMGMDRQSFPSPPTMLDELPDRDELLEFNEIVTKACEPKPEHRYATAALMTEELQLLVLGRSVSRNRAWHRRKQMAWWMLAGCLSVLGVLYAAQQLGFLSPRYVSPVVSAAESLGCEIVFESNRNGRQDIWRMNADGSEARCLTGLPGQNTSPCPSPDGRWIAYVRILDDSKEFRLMGRDGEADHIVGEFQGTNRHVNLQGWLPDSSRLVFLRKHSGGVLKPYTISLTGTDPELLFDPAIVERSAVLAIRFSGDGQRVTFAAEAGEYSPTTEIYVAHCVSNSLLAHTIQRVTTNRTFDFLPALSPDSSAIVFRRSMNPNGFDRPFRTLIVGADGEKADLTLAPRLQDPQPSDWAPAKRILLWATQPGDGHVQVYSVRADGSGLAQLTRDASDNISPRWLPNRQAGE